MLLNVIYKHMIQLIREMLPKYVNATPFDIQVLTPMRKGSLGVENLNEMLQRYLNPPSPEKNEKETARGRFREGDKVMQIKNNYDKEVFNGDIGIIESFDLQDRTWLVNFDGRGIEYDVTELDELVHAYATTIHKAQGSEYPIVVLPVLMNHFVMLQ